LARELGVNESTVFHYEKDEHKPLPGTMKKLAPITAIVEWKYER